MRARTMRNTSKHTMALSMLAGAALGAFGPEIAFAASEGGHHGAGHGVGRLLLNWFNFVVYLIALVYFVRKPVAKAWSDRVAGLRASADQAKIDLQRARDRLAEASAKVSRLDADIAAIARDIKEEAGLEVKALQEDARRAAESLLRRATQTADAEKLQSKRKMNEQFVDYLIEQARGELKSEVSIDNDRERRERLLANAEKVLQ